MNKYLFGKISLPTALYALVTTSVVMGKISAGDFFVAGAVASAAMITVMIAEGST